MELEFRLKAKHYHYQQSPRIPKEVKLYLDWVSVETSREERRKKRNKADLATNSDLDFVSDRL